MTSHETDHEADALSRYQEAMERRDAINQMWEQEGSPLLSSGSTGQLIEHPLLKMLREHDLLVQKLAADVRKVHRGPQPSAVIKPSPAAKLRVMKK